MKLSVKRLLTLAGSLLFSAVAFANQDQTIGDVAETVLGSLGSVETMMVVLCYIAGVGFAGAGILKFKQHKDNPTQVPLGAPIAMIFIAASLIYLPQAIRTTGATLFGGDQKNAGEYLEGYGDGGTGMLD